MEETTQVAVETIAQVDVIRGKIHLPLDEFDEFEKLLLDNYSNKWSDYSTDTLNEDSYCPPSPIVDNILEEITSVFYQVTNQKIVSAQYWGHIHEKNMSTREHNHLNHYVSAILYVATPKGSGDLVFRPKLNHRYHGFGATTLKPERGVYYIFPSYLDHYVTRNQSDEKRISFSINFNKKELTDEH